MSAEAGWHASRYNLVAPAKTPASSMNDDRTMRMETEYLIVGAGVAGSVLAWLLRQAGREVLLIELRDSREKEKPCAGALGAEALSCIESVYGAQALRQLGVTRPPRLSLMCLGKEVAGGVSFATVPRRRLDSWLLAQCIGAGAVIRDRVHLASVGDAAGLAWPTDGGGIHYALLSACLLAESLLGGIPYEEAMASVVEPILREARRAEDSYLRKVFRIALGSRGKTQGL